MRKIATVALAGAIAATAIGATATTASAGDGWRNGPGPQYHQRHRGGHNNNNGGALAAGLFGFTVGALAGSAWAAPPPYYPPAPAYYYPPPPPRPIFVAPQPVYYGDPNAAWCAQQYRSYNPQTNTWVDFQGVVHVCYGPY